ALCIAILAPAAVMLAMRRRRIRRAAIAVAIALAGALVVIAPWAARNAVVLGAPALSTNGGANLLIGTLSDRFERMDPALDCSANMREVPRDRCRRDLALARIANDPIGWLALGAGKLVHTFGYEATPVLQVGWSVGLTVRDPPVMLGIACCSIPYLIV